jgi:hypothetical protein
MLGLTLGAALADGIVPAPEPDRALRSFAPHHLKRLVLVTDGNENSGHVRR